MKSRFFLACGHAAACWFVLLSGCSGSSEEALDTESVDVAPTREASSAAPTDEEEEDAAAPEAPDAATTDAATTDAAIDADAGGASTIRVMSFNIKTGSESSLKAVATVITTEKPDIVGLQEVDELTKRSGKVKQTEVLSKLTGLTNFYFGAAFDFDGGKYGSAILSRFPLSKTRVVRLDDHTTRGNGIEPRIATVAEVTAFGTTFNFASMHASLIAKERSLNAKRITDALMKNQLPSMIVGDLNEEPNLGMATVFTKAGFVDAHREKNPNPLSGWTFPSSIPLRRIDFVYKATSFGPTRESWVPNTKASDHRPVMVTFDLRK